MKYEILVWGINQLNTINYDLNNLLWIFRYNEPNEKYESQTKLIELKKKKII